MKPKLSFDINLVDLCETGYWFCQRCYRVTEPKERDGNFVCLWCESPRIRWNDPIPGQSPQGEPKAGRGGLAAAPAATPQNHENDEVFDSIRL